MAAPPCGCRAWVALTLLFAFALTARARSRGGLSPADDDHRLLAEKHERWMAKYGRSYGDEAEKRRRRAIFGRNAAYVESFNRREGRQYRLGLNKFADLTTEEVKAAHLGFRPASRRAAAAGARAFSYANVTAAEVPPSKDWRKEGAVTGVKNQEECESCWAFSAVAAVEGITKIRTGSLVSLSEQELVDCDTGGEDAGCFGGNMESAFTFIVRRGGLASESAYPYQATDGRCDGAAPAAATIGAYEEVPPTEEALLLAVAHQPVSVGIAGGSRNFIDYAGGIFSGPCGGDMDHAVAVVGYGSTAAGTDYWVIKNSWGQAWGEGGYMRIRRNVGVAGGLCGVAVDASFPV